MGIVKELINLNSELDFSNYKVIIPYSLYDKFDNENVIYRINGSELDTSKIDKTSNILVNYEALINDLDCFTKLSSGTIYVMCNSIHLYSKDFKEKFNYTLLTQNSFKFILICTVDIISN